MSEKLKDLRILLCEDDENLGMLLREYLEAKGYNVELYFNGVDGLEAFTDAPYDLCILDVMMPKMDGYDLATRLRELDSSVPFVFLTAKTLKEDVKKGFELGADDFISKPFSMEELTLRIEAILRRVNGRRLNETSIRQIGEFVFDTKKQLLTINDEQIKLTTKEAELLLLLSNKPGELLPREYALRTIWVDDNFFNARSMDVYITKLRKILKHDPNVEILNVHGKGYKLVISEKEEA